MKDVFEQVTRRTNTMNKSKGITERTQRRPRYRLLDIGTAFGDCGLPFACAGSMFGTDVNTNAVRVNTLWFATPAMSMSCA